MFRKIMFPLGIVLLITVMIWGQDSFTSRDIYLFLWKAKLAPGVDPKQEDLINVAFWWENLKPDVRDIILNTIKNRAMSDREKKRSITKMIPCVVYGTVTMEKGCDVSGVLAFQSCSTTPEGEPGIKVKQEGKGTIVVPYSSMLGLQVLEILDEYGITSSIIIRRADGHIISGKNAEAWELTCEIFNRQTGTVESPRTVRKKIAFGGIETILCSRCFRPMEIDWNFCPYCGVQLPLTGKK